MGRRAAVNTALRITFRMDRRPCAYTLRAGAVAELPALAGERPAVALLDGGVPPTHAARLQAALRDAAGSPLPTRSLPGGERVKSLPELDATLQWLATVRLPRDGTLVGVGGGALLDLAGLAASLWARGIRYVAVPTTLLAMADASVGGKTAVNVGGIKNQAGTFHPAAGILADLEFLRTLPLREWRSGLAEVVKAAVIGAPRLFAGLERRRVALERCFGGDPGGAAAAAAPDAGAVTPPEEVGDLPWVEWIGAAVRVKARIVAADFQEAGPRKALNLGHTLGHALEVAHGLSHGEAVAVGMATSARLAAERGLCPAADAARIAALLRACGLPVTAPAPPAPDLERLIEGDKKRLGGGVGWVLPERIGVVRLDQRVEMDELLRALAPGG